MKKLLLLALTITFYSCEKNEINDILPNITVNITVNLDLPQYIKLRTPTEWVETNGGLKGILILNTGVGSPPYKAFDMACPNNDCSSSMSFDGSLKLTCSCDDSQYSILDGSPQTKGSSYFAREYRVRLINSSTLNITNF